ncbi:uncharacterized protein BXZ73DRAFT_72803 [Epithele typhae]|uniref:uncharacterized protein n=1 Tax=Epithele typhae TaxID=378194 RepID=UPI002008D919|nr:uncharacterized protein BXZ73DRAFT_72803 [Epithele typhae]KAH9945909.1 hypothetical protein BXZ73DRAFT_72803 [Epithele typhae]
MPEPPRYSELVSRIIIVSTLLHYAVADPTPTEVSKSPEDLALISSGDGYNQAVIKVEAVTGTRLSNVITGFLVSPNTDWSEDSETSRVFKPNRADGELLLHTSPTFIKRGSLDCAARIQGVLDIVQYFADPPAVRHAAYDKRCLFAFVVRCSYFDLYLRIAQGDKTWIINKKDEGEGSRMEESSQGTLSKLVNLFKLFTPGGDNESKKGKEGERSQSEEPVDPNANHPTTRIHHILCSIPPRHVPAGRSVAFNDHYMKTALERAGLVSGRDGQYPVTNKNASLWAAVPMHCLCTAMVVLQQVLGSKPVVQAIFSPAVVGRLDAMRRTASMKQRHCDLEGEILWLGQRTSSNSHPELMRKAAGYPTNVRRTDPERSVVDATVGMGEVENVATTSVDLNESPMDHFIRYLRSLVAPLDIMAIISRLANQSTLRPPVTVHAVYVKDSPSKFEFPHDTRLLDELKESWNKTFAVHSSYTAPAEPPDFPYTLKDLWEAGSARAQEHAEAILMGYTLSVHRGTLDLSQEGHDLIDSALLVIAEKSLSTRSTSRVEFVLPGTHGRVVPWYPPSGLPEDVLEEMATRLMMILDQVLENIGRRIGLRTINYFDLSTEDSSHSVHVVESLHYALGRETRPFRSIPRTSLRQSLPIVLPTERRTCLLPAGPSGLILHLTHKDGMSSTLLERGASPSARAYRGGTLYLCRKHGEHALCENGPPAVRAPASFSKSLTTVTSAPKTSALSPEINRRALWQIILRLEHDHKGRSRSEGSGFGFRTTRGYGAGP